MGADGFFARQMVDICSGDAETALGGGSTTGAGATGFDGGKVAGEGGLA